MDLSFLPASASEYNQQRTGTHFTVRSANSPSYSLTRRPGVRRRETSEGARKRESHQAHADTNYTNKEDAVTGYQARTRRNGAKDQSEEMDASGYQVQTTLNLNNTANKPISDSAANEGENRVFEGHGRPEYRINKLPSRSRSLDRRTGTRSPAQGTKADTSMLQATKGAEFTEYARDLEEKKPAESGSTGRLTSVLYCKYTGTSYAQDENPVSHIGQALDWASKGQSLPSRFRSQSGSRFKENLFGPKGGQSIQERIDKLYGSTGEMAAGGTFPRRFSSCERSSSMESRISLTGKDTPGTSLFPRKSTAEVMGHLDNRYSEEGNWGNAWIVGSGTLSLDRARSRHTLAAQIRSGRLAGGTSTSKKSSVVLADTFKGSSEVREQRESGATEENRANRGEAKSGTSALNRIFREKTEKVEVPEKDKRTGEIAKKSDAADEDVFDTNPLKNPLKTAERKEFQMQSLPSATSVRNKISQFEALTQKAGQGSLPRRTFSVPTQYSKLDDGVKKSKSVKVISRQRDEQEGLKAGREEDTVVGKGTKQWSVRSFSVDEVGLGLEKTETGGNDLLGESKSNFSEDFGKYSRLKATLQLPLNQGAQGHSRKFNIDETDFFKASSSDEFNKRVVTASDVSSPQTSDDDDRTPTNIPSDFPFLPPTQPENISPITNRKNTSVATQACKTEGPDSTSLPAATSFHSSSADLLSADVRTAYPKGKRQVAFLNDWIAGLNQDYDCWDAVEKDYEDDDDDSTQMDEDSNYDSDSGDSSVTIISQSERRSYSLSLSDLCNFTGAEYELNEDLDEGQSIGQRSASLSSEMSVFSCVSLLPTEELDRLLEDVRTLGDDALQDYDDVQVVVLHKEVGVGLGFSLAGGADQNKPITVHKVFHSGVAAQEGSIREGDFILSINGTALSESAHWEALRVLRKAKTQEMGVVVLRRVVYRSALKTNVQEHNAGTTQAQYKTGQRVCVQLQKNSRDLGFSLQGGVGSKEGNRPLTIQKIFQGGPVDKVYPGDEVLEIQGVSMTGKRRLEAWTFIKSLPPGLAEVVLHRPTKHVQT